MTRAIWGLVLATGLATAALRTGDLHESDLTVPQITESSTTYCTIGGQSFEFSLSDSDLADSPRWANPKSEPPPMSIARAIQVSEPEVKRYVSGAGDWRLVGVELHTLGVAGKWYYVVSWRPSDPQYIGDNLPIPVLMNGTAVRGSRSNRSPAQFGGTKP